MSEIFTPLSVFIDDSNHGIRYHGNWTFGGGSPTNITSLDYPNVPFSPWYGTLTLSIIPNHHSVPAMPKLTYLFNGTAFIAKFMTLELGSIYLCLIDNVQHTTIEEPSLGHMICKNNNPLSAGVHNLTIVMYDMMFFDGLFYTPPIASLPDSGVDMTYAYESGDINGGIQERLWVNSTRNDTNLADAGDRLDIEYNGISLSIYALIDFHTSEPTFFQYILDDDEAMNFTIITPAINWSSPIATLDRQLILQTPSRDKGLHRLQLSIIQTAGPGPEATWFTIENIVVQNSSSSAELKLAQVPLESLNSSTTDTPSSPSTSSRTSRNHSIIAIIVPILAVFLISLAIWFLRRVIQHRTTSSQENERRIISPFVVSTHPGRMLGFLPQLARREKGSSNHGELGLLPRTMKFNRCELPRAPNAVRRVRYVTHQDGGQVNEPSNHVEEEEEVVNLPPDYSTINRPPSICIAPSPAVGASERRS